MLIPTLLTALLASVSALPQGNHKDGKDGPKGDSPGKWNGKGNNGKGPGGKGNNGKLDMCPVSDAAIHVKAPKVNPWAQISPQDTAAIWELVHAPSAGLNLTAPENATVNDNYVFFIDTLHTNKTAVLPYIDGDAPQPSKYARVVIFEGGKEIPVSQEYMVGPLPVSPSTTIQKLDYIFNGELGGAVPYNARYYDGKRSQAHQPLLISIMSEIADITDGLFGGVYYGSSDNRTNIVASSPTPVSYDGTQSYLTIMFRYPGLASYMTPLDFYVLLDVTGTDASLYKLRSIVTNERAFFSIDELRAAWVAGELKYEFPQTRDQTWALLDIQKDMGKRALDERMAPQSIEIGGKRYKVDQEQQYVEYMGWSFYMGFTRTLGLMFYDIKFKGERILYELSVQEAAAQYAGYQPKAAGTVYQDTYYHLGTTVATLLEGFDCPFGSTLLDTSFPSDDGKTETHPQSICIFESDSGFPVARHRTGSSNEYGFSRLGVVKGSALHVRSIATIGNYDYMFNYAFHVDGSMEVELRASGYLQSSPFYANQTNFGPRVAQGTQGSFHDHIIVYKADFDIVDTKNALEVTEIVVKNQSQPWFPELGVFEQMEYDVSHKEKEEMFNWAPNGQAMYAVISKEKKNKWGVNRGYRLVPGRSNIHLSVQNSPWSRHQSTLLKSQLAVTNAKDTEPYLNSWQNINLPEKPQHDFGKMVDGEDTSQLQVSFALGMHHFTRAEDVPVTLFSEAVSSIVFAPQNFFDRAQEGDLQNRRWVVAEEDGSLSFDNYGIEMPQCGLTFEEPVPHIKPWTKE